MSAEKSYVSNLEARGWEVWTATFPSFSAGSLSCLHVKTGHHGPLLSTEISEDSKLSFWVMNGVYCRAVTLPEGRGFKPSFDPLSPNFLRGQLLLLAIHLTVSMQTCRICKRSRCNAWCICELAPAMIRIVRPFLRSERVSLHSRLKSSWIISEPF